MAKNNFWSGLGTLGHLKDTQVTMAEHQNFSQTMSLLNSENKEFTSMLSTVPMTATSL